MASCFTSCRIAGLVYNILAEAYVEDHLSFENPCLLADRQYSIGYLENGLDDATPYNCQIVDRKNAGINLSFENELH